MGSYKIVDLDSLRSQDKEFEHKIPIPEGYCLKLREQSKISSNAVVFDFNFAGMEQAMFSEVCDSMSHHFKAKKDSSM